MSACSLSFSSLRQAPAFVPNKSELRTGKQGMPEGEHLRIKL